MVTVPISGLSAGTVIASGDLFVYVDVSDLAQAPTGTTKSLTETVLFAGITVPVNVTSASATALAVGRLGATTPAFTVDASTGSQVAGLKVTGAVTGGTVAVVVTDSGSNANLTINAKGTGTIGIGTVSTGLVTITPGAIIGGSNLLTFNGVAATDVGIRKYGSAELILVAGDNSAVAALRMGALVATTGTFSGALGTATTQKLGLNAGLTTYIIESSASVVDTYLGGTIRSRLDVSTFYTPGGAYLVGSLTALANNAAAQVATMTNGPVAGNPSRWIKINDNGTDRYIPAW